MNVYLLVPIYNDRELNSCRVNSQGWSYRTDITALLAKYNIIYLHHTIIVNKLEKVPAADQCACNINSPLSSHFIAIHIHT